MAEQKQNLNRRVPVADKIHRAGAPDFTRPANFHQPTDAGQITG